MAVRDILIYPDPAAENGLRPGEQPRCDGRCALIQDLVDTMLAAGHSVGVAAPQIGDLRRVAVVDVSRSKLGRDNHHGLLTMVNPEIIAREGQKVMREGCMSVPDYTGNVTRAEEIVVEFLDRDGQRAGHPRQRLRGGGDPARTRPPRRPALSRPRLQPEDRRLPPQKVN